jgi:hypothetical protein
MQILFDNSITNEPIAKFISKRNLAKIFLSLHLIQKARRLANATLRRFAGIEVSLERDYSKLQPEGILQLAPLRKYRQ